MSDQLEISVNDEYFDMVPRCTSDEYSALKESIMIEGQQEPIIINEDGIILDGHTRYEICLDLGRTPTYTIKKFKTKDEERFYVINCNLIRRQLNNFQKIQLAHSLYVQIKSQQQYGGDRKKVKKIGSTSAIVGRKIGLNRNLVQQGIWLIENSDEGIIKRLENGSISITKTYSSEKSKNDPPVKKRKWIKKDVVCPHCNQISKREEWRKILN